MSSYPNRPLIGVGVVVLRPGPAGPRVLLVRRGKPPREGSWSLPGGRQRLGERVRETAAREVAEETGCEVEVTALLDVVDSIVREDGSRHDEGAGQLAGAAKGAPKGAAEGTAVGAAMGAIAYHYTLVDFLAAWRGGEARAGGDAAEVAWADPAALAPYALWSETRRLIALACERFDPQDFERQR